MCAQMMFVMLVFMMIMNADAGPVAAAGCWASCAGACYALSGLFGPAAIPACAGITAQCTPICAPLLTMPTP